MENKSKHTPSDLIRVLRNCANEDTRINEAMESASMELDWSDIKDNDRLKTEYRAVALMFSAPELLAALELALIAIDEEAAPNVAEAARAAIAKARGEK